jgi:hypothetical protein
MLPRNSWITLFVATVLAEAAIVLEVVVRSSGRQQISPTLALCGTVLYFGCLSLVPSGRLNWRFAFDGENIALAFFYLQLVVLPWMGLASGLSQGALPSLPSGRVVALGMVVQWVSFVAFLLGQDISIRLLRSRFGRRVVRKDVVVGRPRIVMALVFIAVGGLGMWALFGSLAEFVSFFSSSMEAKTRLLELAGSLKGAVGTFLRPFLPFGLILMWLVAVDRLGRRGTRRLTLSAVTILFAGAVLVSTASFSRATFVVPLIGLLTAYSVRVKRVQLVGVGAVLATLACLVILVGSFRTSERDAADYWRRAAILNEVKSSPASRDIQVYFNSPQFVGLMASEGPSLVANSPTGLNLVASLLAPVPILGREYRAVSGTGIFNRVVYGPIDATDQVPALAGEAYVALGFPGVGLVFGCVGVAMACVRWWQQHSRDGAEDALWFTVGWWVAFLIPGSLAVFSQFLIYGSWPFVTFLVWRALRLEVRGARVNSGQGVVC